MQWPSCLRSNATRACWRGAAAMPGSCWNAATARLARQHNDANMISLGQRLLEEAEALEIVRVWLETPFEGARHLERIRLLDLD